MHHPTDRIAHTTAFVTPVVEHWLEREIAQWVHPMKDRSDDPSHHERTLLPRSYISLPPRMNDTTNEQLAEVMNKERRVHPTVLLQHSVTSDKRSDITVYVTYIKLKSVELSLIAGSHGRGPVTMILSMSTQHRNSLHRSQFSFLPHFILYGMSQSTA